ncbi:MAG: 30S ribosomal protein S6 [Clostridia bacterium]|nr:30S ribosomal protein S6 [Clostridia bacterium]
MANKYEMMVVLNPSIGEEALNALVENVKAKVEEGATIDTMDVLGNKKLAYEIDDQKEGYYLQFNFSAESTFPKEIERKLKITENVMRYLVVRVGE